MPFSMSNCRGMRLAANLAERWSGRRAQGETVMEADDLQSFPETVPAPAGEATLVGDLEVPNGAAGVVLFAHGSGSGRHSPRNRLVARQLREAGLGTLLLDLLTEEEEAEDAVTGQLRFDVRLLAGRLADATTWTEGHPATAGLPVGYFGASTGAAAALIAAARRHKPRRAGVP